jgi:hypothetical protein
MAQEDHPGDAPARARPRSGHRAAGITVRLRPRVRQARRAGARLPRPKAICPECGTVSTFSQHINRRCAKLFDVEGEDEPVRCEGRFGGAVTADRWTMCPDCGATGVSDDAPCPRCNGTGWCYRGGDRPR